MASTVALLLPLPGPAVQTQTPQDKAPRLEFRIAAVFDETESDTAITRTYFPPPRDSILGDRLARELLSSLKARLSNAAVQGVTLRLANDQANGLDSTAELWYDIECDVRINDRKAISAATQIRNRIGAWVYDPRPVEILADDSIKWDDLKATQPTDQDAVNQLPLLAAKIARRISPDLYIALTDISRSLRVHVIAIAPSQGSERPAFDAGFLQRAVEGELARSAAVMVMQSQAHDTTHASYEVDVSQVMSGDRLRIDIGCLKSGSERRLLTSRHMIVQANDLDSLSRGLSELVAEIRQAMEADFVSATRTLAVVATSGAIDFRLKAPSGSDLDVTREIMRATAQKIRLLTETGPVPLMRLQVLSDVPGAARYSEKPMSASEMLSESDAEYLLLLNYQNLGGKVRLTSDLHSYELQHAAAGVYIDEQYVDLSQLDAKLDAIAMKICEYFTNSPRDAADHIRCTNDTTRAALRAIKLRTLERTHRFTARIGSPLYRSNPALFLQRQGGFYGELSYAARVRFRGNGGRFDGIYELTLGLETASVIGSMWTFDGPAVAMGLVSWGFTLTPWAYSTTSFNITVGVTGGVKGMRWTVRPGQLDFTATETYRQSAFVPVWGFFGEVDAPMAFAPKIGLTIITRWLPTTRVVDDFANLPLQRFQSTDGPTGTLGSFYLAAGIAYKF